jgi:hypothetical protein
MNPLLKLMALAPLLLPGYSHAELRNQITLLDMVPSLAPGRQEEPLPIFTDIGFEPGTACMVMPPGMGSPLGLAPFGVSHSAMRQTADPKIRSAFVNARWSIDNWVTNRALPNFCEGAASSFDHGIDIAVDRDSGGGASLRLLLRQSSVMMEINSLNFWREVFGVGVPLFRQRPSRVTSWPNFLINKSMHLADGDLVWLNDIGKDGELRLIFDGALDHVNINRGSVSLASEALPAGAQLQYDPSKHATQLRISITVQYLLKPAELTVDNCQSPDPAKRTPLCSFQGKLLHYMIELFDERYEYYSQWHPTWKGGTAAPRMIEDEGTNSMMYSESLENLMKRCQKAEWFDRGVNPYKQPDRRFALDVNLAPMIRQAILALRTQTMTDYQRGAMSKAVRIRALPMKLPGETDEQYIGHFAISGANIGYEVSGLSQIGFNIYHFRIVAGPKAPADSEGCDASRG